MAESADNGAGAKKVVCVHSLCVRKTGPVVEEVRVRFGGDDGSCDDARFLASLKAVARGLIRPPSGSPDAFRRFRLVRTHAVDAREEVRFYGFKRGPGRPNPHELPPVAGGAPEPLLYGPILVVRTAAAEDGDDAGDNDDGGCRHAPRDLTPAQYEAFREAAFAEESLGEEDSERSTDGSDSGSSLRDFIVDDDDEEWRRDDDETSTDEEEEASDRSTTPVSSTD